MFIVNPKSGAHTANSVVWDFRKYLADKDLPIKQVFTKSLEHGIELANAAANDKHCRMVIAAGGDGTIRCIAEGMAGSRKPLMPLPSGTENLLASELGYDEHLKTVINAFEAGFTRPLDICRANGRYFTCVAGFGFDAQVVHRLSQIRHGNIDQTDYFWPLWRTYWGYKFPPVKVSIDGEDIFQGHGLVFVGNISRYAMGLHILKKANYSDGFVDVCIYKCDSHFSLAKISAYTVLKVHTSSSDIIYRQCKNVLIERLSNDGILCQLDGDPGPDLPVEITVIPQAVNIIVPEGAKPAGIRTRFIRLFQ